MCAPPVTSVRPTSFASQRTQASFTFRIRGFGWSRCRQHGNFMFAGPRDARERNGRQMHGNGARRYGEGRAWSPRRFYGLLARASRGRSREKKVIGGGVMPHHATPNHFPTMPPSARRACQRAVEPPRRPRPTLAISPRTISMHLLTISLARVPRTGKHEGAVLFTTRPSKSSDLKGEGRLRALRSE